MFEVKIQNELGTDHVLKVSDCTNEREACNLALAQACVMYPRHHWLCVWVLPW